MSARVPDENSDAAESSAWQNGSWISEAKAELLLNQAVKFAYEWPWKVTYDWMYEQLGMKRGKRLMKRRGWISALLK